MNQICIYFLLFMIYSVIGWLLEVIGKLITEHRYINRGFLIGPYCPIYGWGGLLMTLLFKRYLDDPVALFILIVVLCSLLEYFTSYAMEKIFKMRWWDYNHFKFNINGRICLETMIPFGIGGLFVMYVLSPFFLDLLGRMNQNLVLCLAIILFVVYVIDNLLSEKIVGNISKFGSELTDDLVKKYKGVKDNTEMIKELINKRIKESKSYLNERLVKAFPNIKIIDLINKNK
ncbi:MAG: putative ABC transporter permease [Bacilli bacterium]|nr:putative ABC transporter permease [Bacilli bacterium]